MPEMIMCCCFLILKVRHPAIIGCGLIKHTGYEEEERERDRIYVSLRDHILRPAC